MKYLTLLIFTLLLCACGNSNRKRDKKDNPEDITSIVPYNNIKDIDTELHRLYSELWESISADLFEYEKFATRLKFHLTNPLTFNNQLPRIDSLIKITITPDGKYKFYSFDEGGFTTGRAYTTYVQYKDAFGNVTFRPWQEKVRGDYTKLYMAIWQFESNSTTYYVAKSYKRGSSRSFYYYMDIFTLTDGIPTFHTEFYPEGIYEPYEVRIVDLDSEKLEYDIPAYDIVVCFTDFGHDDIGFTFNPKDKIVSLTEYETIVDESLPIGERQAIHKKVNHSWKLINIE